MSTTILRLGLWILILCLVLFVVDTSFPNSPVADLIEIPLLQQGLVLAGVLIIVGIIARIFDKTAGKKLGQARCRVCNTPIPHGAIYCRTHLRGMLEREERKTHNTRIR